MCPGPIFVAMSKEGPATSSGYGAVDDADRGSGAARRPSMDKSSEEAAAAIAAARRFTRSTAAAAKFCAALDKAKGEQSGEEPGEESKGPTDVEGAKERTWSDVSNDQVGLIHLVQNSYLLLGALLATSVLAFVAILLKWGPAAEFGLAFLALLPLAMLLGDLTEGLSDWCGPVLGGLMNATLGNATEAIILVQAVRHGLVAVEQAALLGGVLSNLLLVVGLCFFLSKSQNFNSEIALADMGILFIGAVGIVLPTIAASSGGAVESSTPAAQKNILRDSRATSIILLAMYAAVLRFTLFPAEKEEEKGKTKSASGEGTSAEMKPLLDDSEKDEDEEEDGGPPELSLWALLGLLTAITVAMAFLSNALVTNVFPLAHTTGISPALISALLLPVIGNVAEMASAIMAARRGHMDLAFAVALGSAIQIALFLLPVAVLLGWAIDVPMSLDFPWALGGAFFVSVIIGILVLLDGKSDWLEGAMLLGLYAIFSLTLLFDPSNAVQGPAAAPTAAPTPKRLFA